MKRAVIIITLFAIVPLINTVYAQEEGEQQLMFTDESVTRSTNLHYTGEFCSENNN
jgi:hypothetical protein